MNHPWTREPLVPAATQTSPLRVLLVDDNQDYATSLALLLEADGHGVACAFDGLQAIDLACAFKPHVCLLDLSLPSLNGYEVARRLRQLESTRTAYLVAISGWSTPDDVSRSSQAGFDEYLVKPVGLPHIQRILGNLKTLNRAR